MTPFDRPIARETYAVIRFGMGYPARGTPLTPDAMLDRLAEPDRMAESWPMVSFDAALEAGRNLRQAQKDKRRSEAGAMAVKVSRGRIRDAFVQNFVADLARCIETGDPFRERLHRFWSNHFATRARLPHLYAGGGGYAEDAIRPHLAGRFAEMLKAAVTHPFMLMYLDQHRSVGPNSPVGQKRGRGLNENLAREVLELHTLGVDAGYGQADVTQFAELLTGLAFDLKRGGSFRAGMAEPGAERVLGVAYGGGPATIDDIHAVLEDLARHPATATHLCRKLAAHFVADAPDPDLVARMARAWRDSDGYLPAVYAAMLGHRAAWDGFGAKIKQPFEFMATGLRALGVRGEMLADMPTGQVRKALISSLRLMGQTYQRPPGPDGWPDHAGAWVKPHGIAARIAWALRAAERVPGGAPDPRDFVRTALGEAASGALVWAAGAAATRAEGVALVLASAEFNRR